MEYQFKEVVQYLLKEAYIVLINGSPAFTKRFNIELSELTGNLTVGKEVVEISKNSTISTSSLCLAVTTEKKKEIWHKFVQDAEIPWRVKSTDGGTYTVSQYGASAANKLLAIINNTNVNYDTLVQSTKNYYKTVTYKHLLSKYLLNDLWFQEYTQWEKSNNSSVNKFNDGSNWMED